MATAQQFESYLDKLMEELRSFPGDEDLWIIPSGVLNSPGNLGLHIAGNLLHFIGAVMGNTGYVRNRDREFSEKGRSRDEVIHQLEKAKNIVQQVLGTPDGMKGQEEYPELFKGNRVTVNEALAHLLAHLAYHTGQINYLRRMQYPS